MPAPFAALETRATNAVFAHLANVDATVNGVAVSGIFDDGYRLAAVGLAGMAGAQPTLTLPTASVPGSPIGVAAVVNATNYLVAAHEPDGTGMSRLLLERA